MDFVALPLLRVAHVMLPTLALATSVEGLSAQSMGVPPAAATEDGRPRIGLVLSGGSAKGLAHIGVLAVLQQAGIPVDVVTGTSMGALVGGLYAAGYSPNAIERIATTLDWRSIFSDASERRLQAVEQRLIRSRTLVSFPIEDGRLQLPRGVLAGQRISDLFSRLTWPVQTVRDFRQLRRPFTAVATDLESGQAVALDSGSIALALRASMSLPSAFEPVTVNGRVLIDGGLARNLPAQDAVALGADFLICSDVSRPADSAGEEWSILGVLTQAVSFQGNASTAEQRRRCDVLIEPKIDGLSSAAFHEAPKWIARGRAAAEAALPRLQALDRDTSSVNAPQLDTPPATIVKVSAVEIQRLHSEAERLARRVIGLGPQSVVTPDVLEAAVDRLYATRLFTSVTYTLDARGNDTVVVISPVSRESGRLALGIRYDTRYDASLLFAVELRNRRRYGALTRLEFRLGEQTQLAGQFLLSPVGVSRVLLGGSATYTRAPFDIFAGERRVARAKFEVTSADALVGLRLSRSSAVGVAAKLEHAKTVMAIASFDSSQRVDYGSVAVIVRHDNLDRVAFPRRGTSLSARSLWTAGGARFSQHFVDALAIVPLHTRLALRGRVTVGRTPSGHDIVPLHHRFFLGGAYPSAVFPESQLAFVGLRPEERSGSAVDRIGGALQWEVHRGLFATVSANAGRAFDGSGAASTSWVAAAGISLGLLTRLGPLEVTASGRRAALSPRIELNLGYPF